MMAAGARVPLSALVALVQKLPVGVCLLVHTPGQIEQHDLDCAAVVPHPAPRRPQWPRARSLGFRAALPANGIASSVWSLAWMVCVWRSSRAR